MITRAYALVCIALMGAAACASSTQSPVVAPAVQTRSVAEKTHAFCHESIQARLTVTDDAYTRYGKARALSQTGSDTDAQRASEELQRLVLAYPWFALPQRGLGIVYGFRGNWIASYSAYARYLERGADQVDAENVRAEMQSLEQKQPALRAFGEASRLAKEGALDKANEMIRRALAIKPQFALAHRSLGQVLGEQAMLSEAADAYEAYVKLDPNAPDRRAVEALIVKYREGKRGE